MRVNKIIKPFLLINLHIIHYQTAAGAAAAAASQSLYDQLMGQQREVSIICHFYYEPLCPFVSRASYKTVAFLTPKYD